MPLDLPAAFAGIANRVTAAFGSPFYDGLIPQQVTPGHYDDNEVWVPGTAGDPIPCRVQIDDATEMMRTQEGFADGEVVMIILSDGLGIDITTDMKVTIPAGPRAGTWLISQLGRDPAGIGWSAKGRRE